MNDSLVYLVVFISLFLASVLLFLVKPKTKSKQLRVLCNIIGIITVIVYVLGIISFKGEKYNIKEEVVEEYEITKLTNQVVYYGEEESERLSEKWVTLQESNKDGINKVEIVLQSYDTKLFGIPIHHKGYKTNVYIDEETYRNYEMICSHIAYEKENK